jgi:hypothetical protein
MLCVKEMSYTKTAITNAMYAENHKQLLMH